MGVKAKICGITSPGDAALAARHGAWRIGVVFAGGPRVVDVSRARDIVVAADGVAVVGVFGLETVETILEMKERAGLAAAQLHGRADEAMVASLRRHGVAVWQVAQFNDAAGLDAEVLRIGADADAIVVEPRSAGGLGGQGIALPLALARAARRMIAAPRFILAGGLRAETVAETIRLVGPDAVDVSSGVESSPGKKDPAKLARFLEAVRDARPAP